MFTSIKTEIKTWFLTGRAVLLLFLVLLSFVVFAWSSISTLEGLVGGFEHTERFISDDEEIRHIIDSPLIDENGHVNTLLVEKWKIEGIICSVSPGNTLGFCGEVGTYTLPIIMVLFGALSVCRDYSTSVIRSRVAREGKWYYFLSKQIVMVSLSICLTFLAIILYGGISNVFFSKAKGIVTSKFIDISGSDLLKSGTGLLRILLICAICLFFLEIGFCLGYVTRMATVPTAAVAVLWYLNPVPQAYGPQNGFYNLAYRTFDFIGDVPDRLISEIPLSSAIIIILSMFFSLMTILILVWRKRSFYR